MKVTSALYLVRSWRNIRSLTQPEKMKNAKFQGGKRWLREKLQVTLEDPSLRHCVTTPQ